MKFGKFDTSIFNHRFEKSRTWIYEHIARECWQFWWMVNYFQRICEDDGNVINTRNVSRNLHECYWNFVVIGRRPKRWRCNRIGKLVKLFNMAAFEDTFSSWSETFLLFVNAGSIAINSVFLFLFSFLFSCRSRFFFTVSIPVSLWAAQRWDDRCERCVFVFLD